VLADDVLNRGDVNEYFEMSLSDEIEKMGVILKRGEKRKGRKTQAEVKQDEQDILHRRGSS
jgi:hypothetical protein